MTEQTIFLEALDIADPAGRAAYLDRACAGVAGLRDQVEALLAADERSGEFLEIPAVEQMADGAPPRDDTTPFEGARQPVPEEDVLAFLQPSTRPESLGRLAHYEVQEVLGRGGFGTVLKAFDERLHRVVAIKVMALQFAASGAARKRFLREGRSGAAVRDEHVVNIHAVSGDDEPVSFLVMEYVAGQTLQEKIDRAGPLPVCEVLRIGHQIARGLAAAHATGVIHRDIKPANILLENGVERVKITDFGLARAADDASISQSGVVAGTPMYMAPEQAQGEPIDLRADLFSLGSVLYAMCTGRPPFRASTTMAVLKRVCEDTPRPIREINSEIPEWLCAIIAKLHAKKPANRFLTAKEVAELLGQHLAHLQQPALVPLPEPLAAPTPATRVLKPTAKPSPLEKGLRGALPWLGGGVAVALVLLAWAAADRWKEHYDGLKPPDNTAPAPVADKEGWVPLFNGNDLAGWKTHPGQPGNWHVEDGAITCNGPQSHLYTERGDFADFHLRVEAKINETGDSALIFRSGFGAELKGLAGAVPRGYEAQITALPPEGVTATGTLFWLDVLDAAPKNLVRPGEWFTLEVLAQGDRIQVKVDDTTVVNYVDPEKRATRGHIGLQHFNPQTAVFFRKIEIKELPKHSAPGKPFVVLSRQARTEQKFAALAEAVAAAQSGDTIEIGGDGPFALPPIKIEKKALTIRASPGAKPVLKLSPIPKEGPVLIDTDSPLVLEGLDLAAVPEFPPNEPMALIRSKGQPVNAANCRFHLRAGNCIGHFDDQFLAIQLQNCHIINEGLWRAGGTSWPSETIYTWLSSGSARVTMENCVVVGSAIHFRLSKMDPKVTNRSLHLSRNTFFLGPVVSLDFYDKPLLPNNYKGDRPLRIAATGNIFAVSFFATTSGPSQFLPFLDDAEKHFFELLSWQGDRNVYEPNCIWNLCGANPVAGEVPAKNVHRRVQEFRAKAGDGYGIQGKSLFKGGDIFAKWKDNPGQLTPEDFRQVQDSAGYQKAEDGKTDLGADVDLVGPGPAYERWKKTPKYQEWRKQI